MSLVEGPSSFENFGNSLVSCQICVSVHLVRGYLRLKNVLNLLRCLNGTGASVTKNTAQSAWK